MLKRLQNEEEQEKQKILAKRKHENTYLRMAIRDNEASKTRRLSNLQRQKAEEARIQKAHTLYLQQEEADRAREFLVREQHDQEFNGRMVENQQKNHEDKAREEKEMMQRYKKENDICLRFEGECKMREQK